MYLHTSAHPVRADMIHHQHVQARCADRARMAGKHPGAEPGWAMAITDLSLATPLTLALNWNHGGISGDVHYAGHL